MIDKIYYGFVFVFVLVDFFILYVAVETNNPIFSLSLFLLFISFSLFIIIILNNIFGKKQS
jgi:hypothetical protein